MSTILKALRQLEGNRADPKAQPPTSHEPAADPEVRLPVPRRHRRRKPLWLGVGLAIAGAALVTVSVLSEISVREPARPVARVPAAGPTGPAVPSFEIPPLYKVPPPLKVDSFVPPPGGSMERGDGDDAGPMHQSDPGLPHEARLAAEPPAVPQPAGRKPVAGVEREAEVAVPAVVAVRATPKPAPMPPARQLPVELGEPAADPLTAPSTPRKVVRPPVRAVAHSESVPDATPSAVADPGAPVVLSNQDLVGSNSPGIARARVLLRDRREPDLGTEPVVVSTEGLLDTAPVEPVVARRADVIADRRVPVARSPLAPPSLGLDRTRWHPLPERREANVVIDGVGRVVREGDEALGYTLLEITPSWIVFGLAGETVRVRVGSNRDGAE